MDPSKSRERIAHNIKAHGFHLYLVEGELTPRFIYTIGLSEKTGFELTIAGGIGFTDGDAVKIIDKAAKAALKGTLELAEELNLADSGSCSFRLIDRSWITELLLGIPDYYGGSLPSCYQLAPLREHATIDVPEMSRPFSPALEPVWQWLKLPWLFSIPRKSTAITDLRALLGEPVTEATRWEENEWELFAGPGDQQKEVNIRRVPISTLLGFDATLEVVANLNVGEGVWRKSIDDQWHEWRGKVS
jgi:hypothetical protein